MTRLIRFGTYKFDDVAVSLRDNFRDCVPRTQRLPGASGGFDEFGTDRAPLEIGNVALSLWLKADTAAAMLQMRDAIKGLADFGVQDLVIEPAPGAPYRYCRARINSIDIAENFPQRTQINQRVQINFQVSDPTWYAATPSAISAVEANGAETNITVTNTGNKTIPCKLTIATSGTLAAVKVRRMDGILIKDEVAYAAALTSGESIIIDALAMSVKRNGTDGYSSDFSTQHPAWMRVAPGANTLRVILGALETAYIWIEWRDGWY